MTKGLRKVDKSEMTHKNPSLRAGATVTDGTSATRAKSPVPGKKPKPESMRVKKPAKKELEGNKWTVVSQALSPMGFIHPVQLAHTSHCAGELREGTRAGRD